MSEVKKETAEEVTAPAAEGICETNPELIIAEIKKKYKGGEVPARSEDAMRVCRLRRLIDRGTNHHPESIKKPRKPTTPPNEEKHREIKALREKGMTYREIAVEMGLTEDSVRNYCNHWGIKAPWGDGRQRKIDPEAAIKMREEKKTWRQIGEAFGVTETSAMTAVKKYRERMEDKKWSGIQNE
ncbi:MAG: hypothetical protein J6040_02715 [Clostridiales bacterium]|nr:hypothetical protein [Clostridiales bacterium]